MEQSNIISHGLRTHHTFGLGGRIKKNYTIFIFIIYDISIFSDKMISVFQDKSAMELGYNMKYIFIEYQYGALYEGLKDNPNKIPHDDLNLVIL